MKKILVTGSTAYDILLQYDGSFADAVGQADIERLSVSFFSPHYARHHGGTGANIAWNLRLLLQSPLLVSSVGSDGDEYRSLLQNNGVDVSHLELLPKHVTATAIIGTDDASRQIAFFHPGADAHGSWPALDARKSDIGYAVVAARNPVLMMEAVRWCEKQKVPLLFDPGQLIIGLSADELAAGIKASAGVICNAYEWSLLSEKTHMSVDDVLETGSFLVVTHGGDGLTIYVQGIEHVLQACPAEMVVNPTGAGDALRAGFLTGLMQGWDIRHCGMLGAALASFIVEQEGTLLHNLDLNRVLGRAETTYGEVLPEMG
jgi:adenosine kinase